MANAASKTTEVSTNGEANAPMSEAAKMKRVMLLEAQNAPAAGNAAEEIQNNILAATTDDDVFGAAEAGLPSAETLVGIPMTILGFDLVRSTIQDSAMPVYAKVRAVRLATGEPFVFGIGGESSLAQLWKFEALTPFAERPDGVRAAIATKRTGAGFDVLWFRPLTAAENASANALTQS